MVRELIVLESIADSTDEIVYTPTEKRLIHKLRTMLKDTEVKHLRTLNTLVEKQHGERWSDQQLLVYLEMAIGDINAEPPYTGFTLDNFPSSIETTVILGALVFSLIAESILQVGESFSYSDNGISLNINLAQGYQSMAQMLLAGYTTGKANIKRAMRPKAASLASGAGGNTNVRIRSYAPRQWVYR